jgi:tetratricopeptide (TPR) repeat protein
MGTNFNSRIESSRAIRGIVLATAVMLVLPRYATAETAPSIGSASAADAERAATLFQKAKAAVAADNLHDALRLFREAWQLSRTSEVAANLASVEVAFGQHREAAEHFRFALSHLSPSTSEEQKQEIVTGLDAAKRHVLTLVIQGSPAGASISIDGTVVGRAPIVDDVYVEPRVHAVRAEAAGFQSMSMRIEGAAGGTLVVQLALKPMVAAPRPPAPAAEPSNTQRTNKRSPIPLLVGGGVAVAGAVLGTVFWLKADRANEDALSKSSALPPFDNPCGTNTPYVSECNAIHDAYVLEDRNRNLSIASFAVGGAAAAGTLLYWFWPRSHVAAGPAPSAILTPGYAAVRASWAW